MLHMRAYNSFEETNVKFLVNKEIDFCTIEITATGYEKSILDATEPVRAYFIEQSVHDYEKQPQGTENKRLMPAVIYKEWDRIETQASLYRPVTKKGDPRIWFYNFKQHVKPSDIFAIIYFDGKLNVINLTQTNIPKAYESVLANPLHDFISSCKTKRNGVAEELLIKLYDLLEDWQPAEILADTGIGRSVETALHIQMNSSKQPDYEGIELKSHRASSKVKNTLFSQVPDWSLSKCKSSSQIVEKYGYIPAGYTHKTMHATLSASRPNGQDLGLAVNDIEHWLEANHYHATPTAAGTYKKIDNVTVWTLLDLHERLQEKHHETFWIDVDSMIEGGKEFYKLKSILHTKNPISSQFDTLLAQGKITVDFLLSRDSGGDTYSFKIQPKARGLLFPESHIYTTARDY